MLRRTPVLVLLAALAATLLGAVPAQAAPPEVTAITSSKPTIYPLIGTTRRPAATTITVASATDDVSSLEIRTASGFVVRTFDLSASDTVTWNGRGASGNPVAAGSYTLLAYNGTEAAAVTGTVRVSLQRLVRKSATVVALPGKAMWRYVGRCSSLRKPARPGWTGSYLYAANTRCRTQTWNASAVITVHAARVPAAERYVSLRVDAFGGAARSAPRSRAAIEYWDEPGRKFSDFRFSASRLGWHNGPTVPATRYVDAQRLVSWRYMTAYKNKYGVGRFRVVLHYDVLSAS